MKVEELIKETSILNCGSSTKINHSFWPPAALARYQPAGQDFRRGACTSGQEQSRTVCAHTERWLWQQHMAAKTLNLPSREPSAGWSRSPTTDCRCQKDRATTSLPKNTEIIFSVSSARLFTLISSWTEVWQLQKQLWERMTHAQQCPGAMEWAQQSALNEEETEPYLAFREMWGPELLLGMRPCGKCFFLCGQVG